jgi:predicted protein tyrosine phosphatase
MERAVKKPEMNESESATGRIHVLFVCSRNQWRSPTAEHLYRRHPGLSVRSAGTSTEARRRVSADDIRWAHVIIAMESKHKQRVTAEYGRLLVGKTVHVLDIPDDYRYLDPELVTMIEQSFGALLRDWLSQQ